MGVRPVLASSPWTRRSQEQGPKKRLVGRVRSLSIEWLLSCNSHRPDSICESALCYKMAASSVFLSSMVGKARSSNFTLSEKLDLLKLVRPHIRILEEHTNKHAVIVDKNKCWDTVAEQYNALGGDRPHRTAQGLRTLYKRLKESAKQEVMQQRHAQPEYRSSISEPTRKIMEMIPHLFHHVPIHEKDQALRRYSVIFTFDHRHTFLYKRNC